MANNSVEFNHQSVRDLAWAVSSPPLIKQAGSSCTWPDAQWFQQQFDETSNWFRKVDAAPSELETLLKEQKDRRLGKYFETLWFYWFSHNPRYQLIANNLQIIIDGQTLGEIDFIVFDHLTKKTIHWEVAVKFYLGMGDTRQMCHWHGPNLRDRLDIKVGHLLKRQSNVSRNPEIVGWLKQRGLIIDECAVILKGRLYYPWQGNALIETLSPAECAPEHLYSWWFSLDQFDDEFAEEQRFIPLINHGWMERISTAGVKKVYSKHSIVETVSNKVLRLPMNVYPCKPRHIRDSVFLVGSDWVQKNI